jgi:hypothetical protein
MTRDYRPLLNRYGAIRDRQTQSEIERALLFQLDLE